MSRDGSGNYTLPLPDVITGTVIEASWANTTLNDIEAALTDSLSRSGSGGMSTVMKIVDGSVATPGLAFNSEANTGLYRAAAQDARFAVNGVDRMRWSTANGVQIYETTWKSILKGAAGASDNETLRWNNTTGQWDANANCKITAAGFVTCAALKTELVYVGAAASFMNISGGTNNALGADIRLYGESHATNASDMYFYADNNVTLSYDYCSSQWNFQGNSVIAPIVQTPIVRRGVGNDKSTFSGGSSDTSGGNIVLYGETHATKAHDLEIRAGAIVTGHFDYSANSWNFQGNNITTTGWLTGTAVNITSDQGVSRYQTATEKLHLSGGSSNNFGGNIVLYGESHATLPSWIQFRQATTVEAEFNNTNNQWDFKGNSIATTSALYAESAQLSATSGVYRTVDNSYMSLSGGSFADQGSSLRVYGPTHATKPSYIEFLESSTVQLDYNTAINTWDFKNNQVISSSYFSGSEFSASSVEGLTRVDVDSSYIAVRGGKIESTSANIHVFGGSHSTKAYDIEFLSGTTLELNHDYSANQWSFQSNTIHTSSLNSNGTVYSNAGVLTNTNPSDERLKKEIEPLYGLEALEQVRALHPVSFFWKDPEQGGGQQYGLIAQEVGQVLPKLVTEERGFLGLKSDQLGPFLIAAIQELADRVDELENQRR